MITVYEPRKIENFICYEGNRYASETELIQLIDIIKKKKKDLLGVHSDELTALTWAEISSCENIVADAELLLKQIQQKATANNDPVNHPSHYTYSKVEVIDAITAWNLDFCRGNVVKYVARAGKKDDELQDLKKAQFYLSRAIRQLEEKQANESA